MLQKPNWTKCYNPPNVSNIKLKRHEEINIHCIIYANSSNNGQGSESPNKKSTKSFWPGL